MSRPTRGELLARIAADPQALFTPAEVAVLYRVHRRTVTRWSSEHRLPEPKPTQGGHRRWEAQDLAPLFGIVYGGEP
jgi:excisionase family DNA binding protein